MKHLSSVVSVILVLLFTLPATSIEARTSGKKTVTIGLLFDGETVSQQPGIAMFRSEIGALLGSRYDIRIPDSKIYKGDWTLEAITSNYDRMIRDKDVDILIGVGAITCSVIAEKKAYPKPVIALGIIDPVLQGLTPVKNNSSGIPNLTYVLSNKSVVRDLETFHEVYPYTTVGFAYFSELSKIVPKSDKKIIGLMKKLKTSFKLIPVKDGIEDVLNSLNSIDAVYMVYLGKFEGEDKKTLIDALNLRRIPTFGSSVSDVKSGLLASISPEEPLVKILRRIGLNIEAILEGKNASELNVYTSFKENLTINMTTAKKIGYYPKFTVLSKAELINDGIDDTIEQLDLVRTMNEALESNLDLKISKTDLELSKQDLSKVRSGYFPSVSLQADGVIIDRERAEISGGTQAERTTRGDITVSQLLFSDQVSGSITAQKHVYNAAGFSHRATRLDVALEAATAYFNILRSQTNRKILKDNVDLIKRNLEIAKQREMVGYSGRSDVFRWKSQLATASTDYLASREDVKLAKYNLNALLNRKQDAPLNIIDTSLTSDLFRIYTGDDISKYIDNRLSLDIFTDFFIQEALDNSPEMKQMQENRYAIERTLSVHKRKRFIPSASIAGNAERIFSRDGEGADIAGVPQVDDPWSVALTFSLPLYEGGATGTDIRITRLELSRLERQKAILAQTIEQQARAAISDVIVKMITLESSREAADYAKQSLELVQDSYAKGTVSVVELADAQNNSLTSDLAAINSIYEFLISILNMERVAGEIRLLLPEDKKNDFTERFKLFYQTRTGRPPVIHQ